MPMRILILLLLATPVAAQLSETEPRSVYQQREAERRRLWREKQYGPAVALLERMAGMSAFMAIPELRFEVRYNLACGYSLVGKSVEALAALRQVVDETAFDPSTIELDRDFENIRSLAAYTEILNLARRKWEPRKRLWNSPALRIPYRDNLTEDEKVAGLVRFWSEAKYSFAWFDRLIDFDWDAKMLEFLPRVRASRNTADYYKALMAFAALLKDGHTGVAPPPEVRDELRSWPGLRLALVQRRVLVAEVLDPALSAAGVERGAELTSVDALPVWEYAARFVIPLEGASTDQWQDRQTVMYGLLSGSKGSEVRLGFTDEQGRPFEALATRLGWAWRERGPDQRRFEFRKLDAGRVAYVALNTFFEEAIVGDFEKAWAEIRKVPALILDVRENSGGNSGFGQSILEYLLRKGGETGMMRTPVYRPVYRAWSRPEEWWTATRRITPRPGEGYAGRMVLLVGPGTFSAGEDFASAFDVLHAGILVGEPTGGSTGQPLMFELPGGGVARVCSVQDRYADGRTFVGVGIQPTIKVAQTVEDFRAKRDTVLEAAREYLRR